MDNIQSNDSVKEYITYCLKALAYGKSKYTLLSMEQSDLNLHMLTKLLLINLISRS